MSNNTGGLPEKNFFIRLPEGAHASVQDKMCTDNVDTAENRAILKKKGLSDAAASRFLRGFGTLEDALVGLCQYLQWRQGFLVDSITAESPEIISLQNTGKALILEDRDNQDRPIILIVASLCNNKDATKDNLTRFIVYLLEMAGERCNEEFCDTFCIIFDMKDFSVNCLDYCFIKSMIWLLSHYCPERQGVWLFVNLPLLFRSCWPIICKWLDERTAKKVVFISSEEELKQHVPLTALPWNLFP